MILILFLLRVKRLDLPVMVHFCHGDGKGILYLLFRHHITFLRFLSLDLDLGIFEAMIVANFNINCFFFFALLKIEYLENALLYLLAEFVVISVPKDAF